MTTLRKLARYAVLAVLAATAVAFAVIVVLAGEGVELPWEMLPVALSPEQHDSRDEGS